MSAISQCTKGGLLRYGSPPMVGYSHVSEPGGDRQISRATSATVPSSQSRRGNSPRFTLYKKPAASISPSSQRRSTPPAAIAALPKLLQKGGLRIMGYRYSSSSSRLTGKYFSARFAPRKISNVSSVPITLACHSPHPAIIPSAAVVQIAAADVKPLIWGRRDSARD